MCYSIVATHRYLLKPRAKISLRLRLRETLLTANRNIHFALKIWVREGRTHELLFIGRKDTALQG